MPGVHRTTDRRNATTGRLGPFPTAPPFRPGPRAISMHPTHGGM